MTDNLTPSYTGMSRLTSSRGNVEDTDLTNYYSTAPIVTESYEQPPVVDPADNNRLDRVDTSTYYRDTAKLRWGPHKRDYRMSKGGKNNLVPVQQQQKKGGRMGKVAVIRDMTREFAGLDRAYDTADVDEEWRMGASDWGGFGDEFEVELEESLDEQQGLGESRVERDFNIVTPTNLVALNRSAYLEYLGAAKKKKGKSKAKPKAKAKAKPKKSVAKGADYEWKRKASQSIYEWYKLNAQKLSSSEKAAVANIMKNWKTMSKADIKYYVDRVGASIQSRGAYQTRSGTATRQLGARAGSTKKKRGKISWMSLFSFPFGKPKKSLFGALKLIGNLAISGAIIMLVLRFLPAIFQAATKSVEAVSRGVIAVKKMKMFGKSDS